MPPERQKHHTSLEPYSVPKRPSDRRLYSRHRKQQVLLFLLHHRIPSNGSTIGRPLADEPLANDPLSNPAIEGLPILKQLIISESKDSPLLAIGGNPEKRCSKAVSPKNTRLSGHN
jgi:hypothetical protein